MQKKMQMADKAVSVEGGEENNNDIKIRRPLASFRSGTLASELKCIMAKKSWRRKKLFASFVIMTLVTLTGNMWHVNTSPTKAWDWIFVSCIPLQHPILRNLIPLLVLLPSQTLLLVNYVCEKLLHVNPNSVTIPPVYRIPLHKTGKAIQFLLQAVLLHYIAKIHASIHLDLNSLTLSIEPKLQNMYFSIALAIFQYSCSEATYPVYSFITSL